MLPREPPLLPPSRKTAGERGELDLDLLDEEVRLDPEDPEDPEPEFLDPDLEFELSELVPELSSDPGDLVLRCLRRVRLVALLA